MAGWGTGGLELTVCTGIPDAASFWQVRQGMLAAPVPPRRRRGELSALFRLSASSFRPRRVRRIVLTERHVLLSKLMSPVKKSDCFLMSLVPARFLAVVAFLV